MDDAGGSTMAEAVERTDALVVRASRDEDIPVMLEIYRHHIRNGVEPGAMEAAEPFDPEDLKRRRKSMRNHRLPHLVAERRGIVVGYAYAVPFRKRPAYRYTLKHSIYVHHEHLRTGVGQALLQALIDACAAAGRRQMIGYIDAAGTLSGRRAFSYRAIAIWRNASPSRPLRERARSASLRWRRATSGAG